MRVLARVTNAVGGGEYGADFSILESFSRKLLLMMSLL